jgi:putative drug exporter of the RND superfamily
VWIASVVALAVMALGLTTFDTNLTTANSFRDDVEAVRGQEMLEASFPAGASAPTDVIVPDPARVPAVSAALRQTEGVSAVAPIDEGPPGVRLAVTLEPDPYTTEAFDLVPDLRDAAKAAGGGETLVGGPTATEYDLRVASERDLMVIPPIVLVVILVIIGLLLRAIVAPLLLIATWPCRFSPPSASAPWRSTGSSTSRARTPRCPSSASSSSSPWGWTTTSS